MCVKYEKKHVVGRCGQGGDGEFLVTRKTEARGGQCISDTNDQRDGQKKQTTVQKKAKQCDQLNANSCKKTQNTNTP